MGGALAEKGGVVAMRRFFFDPKNRKNNRVWLDVEESHHLTKVLRLAPGNEVELLDGTGRIYGAEVVSVDRNVELLIRVAREEEPEDGPELLLVQSILKGEKMDLVVQKATELGVARMLPVHTCRCQGKLTASVKRLDRWQRISLAACKQSLRPKLMEIMTPVMVQEGLESVPQGFAKLLFWEEERECGLRQYAGQFNSAVGLALFLGPEGGISTQEAALAKNSGWQTVHLGKRILRAETATLTAVSLVQFLAGKI